MPLAPFSTGHANYALIMATGRRKVHHRPAHQRLRGAGRGTTAVADGLNIFRAAVVIDNHGEDASYRRLRRRWFSLGKATKRVQRSGAKSQQRLKSCSAETAGRGGEQGEPVFCDKCHPLTQRCGGAASLTEVNDVDCRIAQRLPGLSTLFAATVVPAALSRTSVHFSNWPPIWRPCQVIEQNDFGGSMAVAPAAGPKRPDSAARSPPRSSSPYR
jgi:hypothetical protein